MSDRMRRVNEAMREVLSDAITQDLKDPRVGFVTVTAVDTSPDLRQARVHFSVLGDDTQQRLTLAGLQAAHGFLQRRGAGRVGPQPHPLPGGRPGGPRPRGPTPPSPRSSS